VEGGDEEVGPAVVIDIAPGGAVTTDASDMGEQTGSVARIAEGKGRRFSAGGADGAGKGDMQKADKDQRAEGEAATSFTWHRVMNHAHDGSR